MRESFDIYEAILLRHQYFGPQKGVKLEKSNFTHVIFLNAPIKQYLPKIQFHIKKSSAEQNKLSSAQTNRRGGLGLGLGLPWKFVYILTSDLGARNFDINQTYGLIGSKRGRAKGKGGDGG